MLSGNLNNNNLDFATENEILGWILNFDWFLLSIPQFASANFIPTEINERNSSSHHRIANEFWRTESFSFIQFTYLLALSALV